MRRKWASVLFQVIICTKVLMEKQCGVGRSEVEEGPRPNGRLGYDRSMAGTGQMATDVDCQ